MLEIGQQALGVLLAIHIATGVVGLVAGFGALAVRKGGRLHRTAGKVFIPAMVAMLTQAAILSLIVPDRTDWAGMPFFIYLTLTAWTAARIPDGLGRYGRLLTLFGAASALGLLGLIGVGLINGKPLLDGPESVATLIFALVAVLTIGLDLRVLARGGIAGPPRIRRHVWRVCVALFFASGSLFLGQQDEFPAAIQGPVWYIPALAPLVLMIFWMWRYRNPKKRRPLAGTAEAAA